MLTLLFLRHRPPAPARPRSQTPLHFAAMKGGSRVARLLLRAGAEIDAVDIKGQTPLHLAAKCPGTGAMEVVKELIVCGASVALLSNTGARALDEARQLFWTHCFFPPPPAISHVFLGVAPPLTRHVLRSF